MDSDNDESSSVGTGKEVASNPQVLRPRRNVMQKNADFNNGLHWIEEKDLKKALYASLQESKKLKLDVEVDTGDPVGMSQGRKRKNDALANGEEAGEGGKRSKVHAQRKFAQGSNPTSPTVTPIKMKSSLTASVDFPPMKRPKTEDFLTFLCLRGTPVLPSALSHFSVAAKQESNGDSRCQSPIIGDTAEKQKSHPKMTGAVTKVFGKAAKPTGIIPQIKTRPATKKPAFENQSHSSSESSVSDSENEPYKTRYSFNNAKEKRQGKNAVTANTTKQKTENHGSSSKVLNTSVQALKQKYRQQRIAKEKEALVRTKNSPNKDVSKMCKVSNDVRLILDKWPSSEFSTVNVSSFASTSKEKGNSYGAMQTKNASSTSSGKKEVSVTKVPPPPRNLKDEDSSRKPVTRHAAILLQAAREKAEKELITKLAEKAASDEAKKKSVSEQNDVISDYEKHLPLLESEHSYFKRLPIDETPPKQKVSSPLRHSSDFSSSDDEPLVKKKDVVSRVNQKQSTPVSKNGVVKVEKPCRRGRPSGSYLTRSLRSLEPSRNSSEVESRLPVTDKRPSRKTKEAASMYLELLGQRLNSCDDDYEVPPKPNSLLKCDYKKQLLTTPVKQRQPPLRSKSNEAAVSINKLKSSSALDMSTSSSSSSSSSSANNNSSSSSSSSSSSTSTSSSSPPNESPGKNAGRVGFRTIKKWPPVGKSPTVVQCLNTPLERIDVVKTRDFMRKLSDARFNQARDQTEKMCSKKVTHSRQTVMIHNIEDAKYLSKSNIMKLQDRRGSASKYIALPDRQGKAVMSKYLKSKAVETSVVVNTCAMKTTNTNNKKVKKNVPRKNAEIMTKGNNSFGSREVYLPRVNKNRNRVEVDSLSSDSSSCSPAPPPKVVPYKRGPGRVPAMHALRHIPIPDIPDSSSTDSSDEDEVPSKPEATTISVRQNVTSNSVAVQVNLLNDMSDFEDDCWEPGFMESGIEGLFTMERVATPIFPKSSPQQHRMSWESEIGGKGLGSKSREHTPTKIKSEVMMGCQAGNSRLSNSPKRLNRCPTSSSSSPSPITHKDFKRPVQEKSLQLESSSDDDDDSSGFHIPIGTLSGVKEAPVFYPTEKEFQDPLIYIEKIRPQAEKFGVCRIVPPPSFKPECKVSNEMRFTGHNQYIHKLFHRFGPNVQQLNVIKKPLEAQKIEFDNPPLIGGMEIDLPRLFHTVQQYGGLKEVIEKKKWQKVADSMKIAKSALDKVSKLYEAYCKYLLPYDTLSKQEKQEIENKMCVERKKERYPEIDDCVTKGRSMSLSSFYRIARNTLAMWSKNDAKPSEVEQEYWRIVNQRKYHLCVHAGNIDSSTFGYGFSSNKNSNFGKHPWNLKILTNNTKSILRCMGPVIGVTIPTLHVGMTFTTGCWYRDPHCLPWIEYLHTGASKIWYSVPASQSCKFRDAMRKTVPDFCTNNPIWLPSDTAMVPPDVLVENGASLYRLVQNTGQFVVVFPRVFTSTICCGYNISESVYFAGSDWLEIAPIAFKEISDSCEPAVFSLHRLLIGIAKDNRISVDVLHQVLPLLKEMRDYEIEMRKRLYNLGLKLFRLVKNFEVKDSKNRQSKNQENQVEECDICRAICFISLVYNKQESVVYCLRHAVDHLQKKKKDLKFCELMYTFDTTDLDRLIRETNAQLQAKNTTKRLKKSVAKKAS